MIKRLLLAIFCILCLANLSAQNKQDNYQIVVKDANNQWVSTNNARVLIAFVQNPSQKTPVYTEIHSNQTIQNGLLTLSIGKGVAVVGKVSDIDINAPLYLRCLIDVNGGTNYTIEGNDTILSLKNIIDKFEIDTTDNNPNGCTVMEIRKNETGKRRFITAVRDHEGNTYAIVEVGGKCWLRENMRCASSRTTQQPFLQNTIKYSESEKYAFHYNNDPEYSKTYGLLYNWPAANDICPAGWRLPTQTDWVALLSAAGATEANAKNGWTGDGANRLCYGDQWKRSSEMDAAGNNALLERNSTNFSLLPGGELTTDFNSVTRYANLWTSTQCSKMNAFYVYVAYNSPGFNIGNYGMHNAYSVRCVRNE